MPSSLPQDLPSPYNDAFSRPDPSVDYATGSSSFREATAQSTSAPTQVRREPLAFGAIRHRMEEDEVEREGLETRHSEVSGRLYANH
jgi:hypothetical protein